MYNPVLSMEYVPVNKITAIGFMTVGRGFVLGQGLAKTK
jgi:hypothetical protein